LSRLRAWKPTSPTTVKAISREELAFPNTYERNRLQTLLTITEPMNGKASIKNAQDYAELAAEYLLLLDTSTNTGKTEARRVLEVSLKKFQEAQAFETLSPLHEELIEAIKRPLEQLSK
jgi:acyl-coenzyme A synthetase/AMP-(fatty) acid ligase